MSKTTNFLIYFSALMISVVAIALLAFTATTSSSVAAAASPKGASKKEKTKSASEEIEMKQTGNEKTSSSEPSEKKTQQKEEEQKEAVVDATTTKSNNNNVAAAVVSIQGTLGNITRMARDAQSGQLLRYHPKGSARISVNGGDNVFFSDVTGNFALLLPAAPTGSYAANSKHHNRVALYQLDIDWDKLAFPRVLVEVDEFSNFRAYIDGSGKMVGTSKGRIGVESGNTNKQQQASAKKQQQHKKKKSFQQQDDEDEDREENTNNDDDDFDSFDSSNNQQERLLIEAQGEYEYFVPRQQFRVLDFLKNPMIIMMLVTAGMVYVMPMLVDQDDMKKQMRDLQSVASGAASAVEEKSNNNNEGAATTTAKKVRHQKE